MIATRGGTCRGCHEAFDPGTPIFFTKDHGTWHWECFEDQPQPPHIVELAEQLGFRKESPQAFSEEEREWAF